jgi:hypothetical protein
VRQVPVAGLTGESGAGRYDYRLAGFRAEAGTGALAPGKWGVFVCVTAQGVTKQAPLGRSRDPAIGDGVRSPDGRLSAGFTRYGTLALSVEDGGGAA